MSTYRRRTRMVTAYRSVHNSGYTRTMKTVLQLSLVLIAGTAAMRADEVTDWNRILLDATLVTVPAPTPGIVATRVAAIVQAAVFDAVNGIERRFTPIHVLPAAPPGASQRAAAVQAAYASLVLLYPSQAATLSQKRAVSLDGIASGAAAEHSQSIARGIEWGQTVADAIWAWRSTDGFLNAPPPFTGGLAPGQWRPTPPGFAPGLVPQLAHVTPWVINFPAQFRPGPPPALTSALYAAEFNEVKSLGSAGSAVRTPDQTLSARFWQSANPAVFWDAVATSIGAQRHLTLSENARLLALINIASADAGIACWDAKYFYNFWRPITAIQLGDTDGNADTTADPNWQPLLTTPPYPEYVSGHLSTSSAAVRLLSNYFGDNTPINVDSLGMPGVVRSFASFSAALDELRSARIWAGFHFRTADNEGQKLGTAVADWITISIPFSRSTGSTRGRSGIKLGLPESTRYRRCYNLEPNRPGATPVNGPRNGFWPLATHRRVVPLRAAALTGASWGFSRRRVPG
jgi:hypothetical protein